MLQNESTESLKWNWTQVQMFALESSSTYEWKALLWKSKPSMFPGLLTSPGTVGTGPALCTICHVMIEWESDVMVTP